MKLIEDVCMSRIVVKSSPLTESVDVNEECVYSARYICKCVKTTRLRDVTGRHRNAKRTRFSLLVAVCREFAEKNMKDVRWRTAKVHVRRGQAGEQY